VTGDTVRFQFVAKEGIHQDLSIEDAELAKVIKRRLTDKAGGDKLLPGTNDQKMRDWVQEHAPGHRPYDFRTRLATLTAMQQVSIMPTPQSAKEMKKQINVVGDEVAKLLGNKRKQALESYINPTVFRKWQEAVDNIEQGGAP